jgi:N-methylhydantoinase A
LEKEIKEQAKSGPRLSVDIGGTFTDIVVQYEDQIECFKVLTTPEAPEIGFLSGVELALSSTGHSADDFTCIMHGTTLATNALIERKGARVVLVTTNGVRDSIEIGMESRYDQYDLNIEPIPVLVPRERRLVVNERIDANGQLHTPLDTAELEALVPKIKEMNVDAIAIGFLHSYRSTAHEMEAAEILRAHFPDIPISLSGLVCPEMREYERFTTTTANAYVQPLMSRYLRAVRLALVERGFDCPFYMITSAGNMTTFETAEAFPIRLVESGPSGGASLAKTIAARCGETNVVSFDMGGTTAKICLIEDFQPKSSRQFEVARAARFTKGSGLPLRIPVVEMIEIGAGGGSIATVDALGRVTVGPESAGADPGPACYGKGGGSPTVTDADLLLGRIDPNNFAKGRVPLHADVAKEAVLAAFAKENFADETEAAHGISEIVDENMANAASVHAVEYGKNLLDMTMISFGGAGPLHAGRIAEKVGVKKLIVPLNPSVGSAIGFLWSPIAYEVVRSLYVQINEFPLDEVNEMLLELEQEANDIVSAAAPGEPSEIRRTALMRYVGQGHEVEVPVPNGTLDEASTRVIRDSYEALYHAQYDRSLAANPIEIITWNVMVSAASIQPERQKDVTATEPATPNRVGKMFDAKAEQFVDTNIFLREDLSPGETFEGPCIVQEDLTTTIVPADFAGIVDSACNLILEIRKSEKNNG